MSDDELPKNAVPVADPLSNKVASEGTPKFKQIILIPDSTGGPHKSKSRMFDYADAVATANEKEVAEHLRQNPAFWVAGGVDIVVEPSGGKVAMHMEIERVSASQLWFYDPNDEERTADAFVAVLGLLTQSNEDENNIYVHGNTIREFRGAGYPAEANDPHRPLSLLIFRTERLAAEPIGVSVSAFAAVAAAVFFRRLGII